MFILIPCFSINITRFSSTFLFFFVELVYSCIKAHFPVRFNTFLCKSRRHKVPGWDEPKMSAMDNISGDDINCVFHVNQYFGLYNHRSPFTLYNTRRQLNIYFYAVNVVYLPL